MAKKKFIPIEGRIMSGATTTAPSPWLERVRPEGKVVVFREWCKRCGICTEFCPPGALEVDSQGYPVLAHPEQCTLCGLCWMRCPDLAIIKGPELPENKLSEEEAERTRQQYGENGFSEEESLKSDECKKNKQEKAKPKKNNKSNDTNTKKESSEKK